VRWFSEHRGHLYRSMPPAHSILPKEEQWDKTLWGPTANSGVSFSHTEPLTKLPSQVPQQPNLTSLRKLPKLLIIPALFPLTVNFPLDSHRALFPHHNHLWLLTAMATFSFYSMKHLAGSMASIHRLPHGSHFLGSCPSLISGGKHALATFPTGR